MHFTLARDQLLKPLQLAAGVLANRPSVPVLGNLLVQVSNQQLRLTSTDLEVEMQVVIPLENPAVEGTATLPGKKWVDIVRGLNDVASIDVKIDGERATLRAGRSRFTLATMPAQDFPSLDDWQPEVSLFLPQQQLRQLIERTAFSMASQDVRYYLNGMLFETENDTLNTVATDGHRLAMASVNLGEVVPAQQVIVPRKGVLEVTRLLTDDEALVQIQIGAGNIRFLIGHFSFTCKLVDGRFPDYRRVIPQGGDKVLVSGRDELRQALIRAAILSSDQLRGVRLQIEPGLLTITANNREQEEAVEQLDVQYDQVALELGFNVSYLLDVLNALRAEQITMTFSNPNASAVIEAFGSAKQEALYVVMPMRL